MRQLVRIAHGVEPGDEVVVDTDRDDGVDPAVSPGDQRRVPVDLGWVQRGRRGDPAQHVGHGAGPGDGFGELQEVVDGSRMEPNTVEQWTVVGSYRLF